MNMGGGRKNVVVPWRQDFRDVALLPDIKIVRTNFIFNLIAVMFLVITAGVAVYQQYLISVKKMTLLELEQTTRAGIAADNRNKTDSADFLRDIQKVEETVAFPDIIAKPELLLVQVSKLQPAEGFVKSFDFSCIRTSGNGVNFIVTIAGTMTGGRSKSAPEFIGTFLDDLNRDSDFWKGTEHHAELVFANPVPEMNYFEYSLRLTMSPEKKGKASK